MKLVLKAVLFIGFIGLLVSCSQESNSFVSRSYHNMAARYNCYFLAKERMLLVEEKLFDHHVDDYNYILPYFPLLDTNFSTSLQSDLDYIFEKAKIPITKHKNSNWVAESYNIIGKSKWLGNKIDTAIYVHKYVIAKSQDIPGKQIAQIALLRTYVSQNDMRSAEDQYYQLKKQKIFEENQKDYSIACLEYHYYLRAFDEMLPHLDVLLPLVKKKDLRSRIHFIKGQINQRNGNNKKAYAAYKKSLKRNPPYEIEFNAKLNLSQVTNIESREQLKKTNKYYDKMLEDDKNIEYHGRIYYERGKFELKRGNLHKAVSYLNKSLDAIGTPQEQKAYAYLLLGQLHYNEIDTLPTKVDKYKTAQLYYDSTVTSMSYNFENAEDIIERQVILNNFVKQLEIVETEERLQVWATLSPEELEAEVAKKMAADKEKLEREAAIRKKNAERAKSAPAFDDVEGIQFNGTSFFAYNPIAVSSQKIKFEQKWGDRILEDNWRRSDKESVAVIPENNPDISSTDSSRLDSSLAQVDTLGEKEIVLDKGAYTAFIPSDPASLAASNTKLMDAKYKLGKIYYYDLEELENAQEVFQSYLELFPNTKYEAEVIYFLYLICQRSESCNAKDYVALEKQKYPNSLFYKLMENIDYLSENEEENKASHLLYEQAFEQFKKGQYLNSRKLLAQNKSTFPKSDILDKIEFLDIMIYAETDRLENYYYGMEQFITLFGTSPLRHKAKEILSYKPATIIASNVVDTTYYRNDSSVHYFVGVFKPKEMPYEEINRIYQEFRYNYFRTLDIQTKNIEFTDSTYLIVNKEFDSFESAKTYYDKLMDYHEFGKHLEKVEYSYYLVTVQNYKTLIATHNIDGFSKFYRDKYKFRK